MHHMALHTSFQPGKYPPLDVSWGGKITIYSLCPVLPNPNPYPLTWFPLPTFFLCPVSSDHRSLLSTKASQLQNNSQVPRAITWGSQSLMIKRNKASSFPSLSQAARVPQLPGDLAWARLPQDNTPKRITFSIYNLILFSFNVCCVLSLCRESTSLSFCLLFVLLLVQWKCIGFSVSDYTSSHTQFITPCPKEQM